MIKLITTDSFDWQKCAGAPDRLVTMLEVSSKGVDKRQLTKQASMFTREIADIRPTPGSAYLHVIAMGSSEDYGPNKNADGYKRATLIRDHPTFVTDAKVYKEHKNDNVKYASGDVPFATYNPDMHRVELIMRVDEPKWEGELQKWASGGDITVSMSCQVPYDECSICGNQAKTRREYCECMKKYAGVQLDDGRTVHVDNPYTRYIDISGVANRADRIAFALRKVASADGPVVTGAELYELTRNLLTNKKASYRSAQKQAMLRKLAEIEKQVEGVIHGAGHGNPLMELSGAFSPDIELEQQDADELTRQAEKDLGKVLQSLGDARISLSLRDFARIVLRNHDDSAVAGAERALPGIFCKALGEGGDDLCDDGEYDCHSGSGLPSGLSGLLNRVSSMMSLDDGPVTGRTMTVTIHGGRMPTVKKASAAVIVPAADLLAREYAKYKLSLFDKCASDGRGISPMFYWLGVLQNYIGD